MGMDLIAIAPTTDKHAAWYVNWRGWASIGGMLQELGCNTSEMAGVNDGEPIAASTMTEWADAIDEALQAGRQSTRTITFLMRQDCGSRTSLRFAVIVAVVSSGNLPAGTWAPRL